jgi:hypothetical protein
MIKAKIIADSITTYGKRVTTFELEYPRYIHAEVMTHRVFSRNAASSRAIPIAKMVEQAELNTVMPIWTKNQAGMQGGVIKDGATIHTANDIMLEILDHVVSGVKALDGLGIHKQNVNRYLEPFQHIKTVLTGAEFDNFFNLRYHADAQGEIKMLAQSMLAEFSISTPKLLNEWEWHLPYAMTAEEIEFCGAKLEDQKKISASCCAQVSYRLSDPSQEKAEVIYDRLVYSEPMHASPFEHQCRPILASEEQIGNLEGFRQLRYEIEKK